MEMSKLFGFCVLSLSILKSCQAEECFHDEYKEETESITSKNFPVGYPANWCAQWYITARKGEIITLSIYLDIEVGDDSRCNRDSLTIGPEPLKQYCGRNKQLVYISNISHVWLKFNSDGIVSGKGFQINYIRGPAQAKFCKDDQFHCKNGKCIPLNKWLCNGLDECGDGSDENDAICHSATAMPTATPSIVCREEFFPCYSNLSEAFICLPRAKKCDGISDCYGGIDEKNCSINCNKHIHSEVGYITSPLYPRDYPPHMDCKWTIHMQNPTDRIQLRLIEFAVQANENTDYVMVYDGKDEENDRVLGTFYGGLVPPPKLESTSNWMTIVFHSDNSFSEKGFNFSYQIKGFCLKNQSPCGHGEDDCFDKDEKCNGIWDCKEMGGDELHCGNCNVLYSCGSGSSQCYPKSHRCNGVGFCTNKMDEKNCSPQQCGTHNGTFLCQNKNCIYEAWVCDKTDDCGDQSDEMNCSKTTNLIIIAAVSGSLICGLLLVVALGCTCKLYNLRQQQLHGPRHETPLSRVYAEFMRRRAPPPYHEAMLTSRPYEEARREYMERINQSEGQGSRSSDRRSRRQRRRNGRNQNLPNHNTETSNDLTQNVNEENIGANTSDTVSTIAEETVNSTHSNIGRHSSRTALIPSDSSSDTESELGSPTADSVRVHFSEDSGISAQFHRRSSPGKEVEEGQSSSSIPINSPTTGPDISSLDNTTIASCDSVEPPQEEDKNKPRDISSALTPLENPPSNSTCALFIPENGQNQGSVDRGRRNSAGSLDSTGSENPWGDFTHSESV